MKFYKKFDIERLSPIILFVLVCIILLPNIIHMPGRDSGAFLYIGQRMVEGDIPYRDLWDHKPPAIFFINALGLLIGSGSRLGVWLIEFIAIYCAALFGFWAMKRAYGLIPALLASCGWLLALVSVLEGGNLTESYALSLQFASIYLFYISEEKDMYSWRGFLIGVLCAIGFLLRQNLIGVWIAIVIYLFFSRIVKRHLYRLVVDCGLILFGVLCVAFLVIGYFGIHHSVNYFWEAAFKYNFIFAERTFLSRVITLFTGLDCFPWYIMVISIWGIAIIYFVRCKEHVNYYPLLMVSIIGLPIELLFTCISGRDFGHYFMAWLPMMAFLFGYCIYFFVDLCLRHYSRKDIGDKFFNVCERKYFVLFFTLLVLTMNVKPLYILLNDYLYILQKRQSISEQRAINATEYIINSTSQNDCVLMWGAEGGINFLSKRHSPTRYFYQYPLVTAGYQTEFMMKEFLADVVAREPKLIIDTKNKRLPPINSHMREEWIKQKSMGREVYQSLQGNFESFFEYVSAKYKFDRKIDKWDCYIRNE